MNKLFDIEPGAILILVLSCVISFTLGRYLVSSRNKRRQKKELERAELALRNRPPEPPSLNKSKRKRQQLGDKSSTRPRV
jgi:biopolymer transport protein ExbB/TolQ